MQFLQDFLDRSKQLNQTPAVSSIILPIMDQTRNIKLFIRA